MRLEQCHCGSRAMYQRALQQVELLSICQAVAQFHPVWFLCVSGDRECSGALVRYFVRRSKPEYKIETLALDFFQLWMNLGGGIMSQEKMNTKLLI